MKRIYTYKNKYNEHKYIEVKRTPCGHYYFRQFIKGFNPTLGVNFKNYSVTDNRKGRKHKPIWLKTTRKFIIDTIIEQYDLVGVKAINRRV